MGLVHQHYSTWEIFATKNLIKNLSDRKLDDYILFNIIMFVGYNYIKWKLKIKYNLIWKLRILCTFSNYFRFTWEIFAMKHLIKILSDRKLVDCILFNIIMFIGYNYIKWKWKIKYNLIWKMRILCTFSNYFRFTWEILVMKHIIYILFNSVLLHLNEYNNLH